MNNISSIIKCALEKDFHFKFNVKKIFDQNEKYEVTPSDSFNNTFVLTITVRENTRLIITCEPSIYGNAFLENINASKLKSRNIFCSYWKTIGEKYLRIKINGFEQSFDDFCRDEQKWYKFEIRYSKAPFYEDSLEEKINNIISSTSMICGMLLSITSYYIEGYSEGKVTHITTKRYERNPINRNLCLAVNGYKCNVCGMSFERTYGDIGKNFIHVHHIVPLHLIGEEYVIDPINDLVPVCPNCHYMLHRIDPPYSIEQLKEKIKANK